MGNQETSFHRVVINSGVSSSNIQRKRNAVIEVQKLGHDKSELKEKLSYAENSRYFK